MSESKFPILYWNGQCLEKSITATTEQRFGFPSHNKKNQEIESWYRADFADLWREALEMGDFADFGALVVTSSDQTHIQLMPDPHPLLTQQISL